MNKPMRKVSIALAVLFLALFVNLNYVQIVKGNSYRDNPANSRVLLNEYSTPRGQIVVQGGVTVAESVATKDELKYLRKYPQGAIYAPATGYYSFVYGAGGIEAAENDVLSGDSPQLFTSKLANILTGRNPRGGSVNLTIYKAAQEAAFHAMEGEDGQLRKGAVVALDPTTGAILAMVSTPSYDPNALSSHDADSINAAWAADIKQDARGGSLLLNRATSQTYPAGSIFKIIDAAAALKEGVKPTQSISAPNSYWPYDPARTSSCPASLDAACVQNFEGETCQNGKTATLDFAFAKSCNTAFAALAVEKLGASKLQAQASAFGFDSPSTLRVPLPVVGSTLGDPAVLKDPAALAQTAFGQRNVRITPMQAAMLASAVANNGVLMKPYLVASELKPNLSTLSKAEPQQLSQVIDPNLDPDLVKMMEDVITSPEGTGGPANIASSFKSSVVVGGKTGTADTGLTSASDSAPDAWFTGFAMVNGQPKIAVAVVIENGGVAGNESAGGKAAGPVAAAVMKAYLQSIGVS